MNTVIDPREMRKHLNEVAIGRYPGLHNSPSALIVRTCMDQGRYTGLSGEDTMTMIAYHLMLRHDQLYEKVLQSAVLNISTAIVKDGAP